MSRYQLGATLVSLLVGLLIAMLCIIAVLTAYKTIVKSGVDSRRASTHDTQLQSGITSAQMFLQNAGFGLDGNNHVLSTTLEINSKNANTILWRFKEGSNIICQGLADIEGENNVNRRLVLVEGFVDDSNTACNQIDNLSSFVWKVQSTLSTLEDYSTDQSNPIQVSFVQESKACIPFGATDSSEITQHPYITISVATSTQKIAGLEKVKVPVCLVNIAV
ncbi:hypothetical protein FSC02_00485 [Acinetobacter indicus]|jgi:hypothetical protein|uniref:hypothetical protein n=1 Tax=Acinetobacter TaxID=469 RepID=UPI0013B06E7D|nr:hypothetical protein [Acinetobacter indicus]QIC77714.1 hypothetical protein FSC02_00485 [Acinetobacter indicus]